MPKRFKNNKESVDTWAGQIIQPGAYHTILVEDLFNWQNDSKVLSSIASGEGTMNDGDSDITDVAKAINFLKDDIKNVHILDSSAIMTTQFERTDLTLKMARIKGDAVDGVIEISLKIPGEFGVDGGRHVAGGYGIIDTYDPDDVLRVWVEDKDRLIAWALALAQDPEATEPLSDETIQQMGALPAPLDAFGTLPEYPVIGYYTDEEFDSENQGWYFWPCALGNDLPPIGEIEVEPLGFYGNIPAGLYIVFRVDRLNLQTGTLRGDIFWGKKDG